MSDLVKKSATSTELARISDAAPPKLFKHSNFEPLVLKPSSSRVLTPVIDREAWTNATNGMGSFMPLMLGFMGWFMVAMPIASPFIGGIAFNPAALIVMIPGAAIGPAGFFSAWRHTGRVRWVKQTSARRIRAWLSTSYGIHGAEIEPKVADRFLNRAKVGATLPLVDEVGRAFTIYRVAANKYVVRDVEREVVPQLPAAAEAPEPLRPGTDPSAKRLPRSTRALYEWAGVLHSTLAAKGGLSAEHEHRIDRAGEVLGEVAQMTAALSKNPSAAFVKNVEEALNSILHDMEGVKDELEEAINRQAEVLAIYAREVTGKHGAK